MDVANLTASACGACKHFPIHNDSAPYAGTKWAVNLGWGVFSIKDTLEEILKIPVMAGNDANVAALGELWQGGGRGYRDMGMIPLGTGVGGGVILDAAPLKCLLLIIFS